MSGSSANTRGSIEKPSRLHTAHKEWASRRCRIRESLTFKNSAASRVNSCGFSSFMSTRDPPELQQQRRSHGMPIPRILTFMSTASETLIGYSPAVARLPRPNAAV